MPGGAGRGPDVGAGRTAQRNGWAARLSAAPGPGRSNGRWQRACTTPLPHQHRYSIARCPPRIDVRIPPGRGVAQRGPSAAARLAAGRSGRLPVPAVDRDLPLAGADRQDPTPVLAPPPAARSGVTSSRALGPRLSTRAAGYHRAVTGLLLPLVLAAVLSVVAVRAARSGAPPRPPGRVRVPRRALTAAGLAAATAAGLLALAGQGAAPR